MEPIRFGDELRCVMSVMAERAAGWVFLSPRNYQPPLLHREQRDKSSVLRERATGQIFGTSRITFLLVSLSTTAAMELTPLGARLDAATSASTEQQADLGFPFPLNKKRNVPREDILFGSNVLREERFPAKGEVILWCIPKAWRCSRCHGR